MKMGNLGATIALAGLLTACANQTQTAAMAGASEKIFETNVTNDLSISSGEPEIAIDPSNPKHLAIIEFGMGSKDEPAASFDFFNFDSPDPDPAKVVASSLSTGRVMLSKDGGSHWTQAGLPPASNPDSPMHGGGDPMIAIGPDGTIYAADEPLPPTRPRFGNPPGREYMSSQSFMIAASTNGGRTFGPPRSVGTPIDRPWLKVDQSTGTVYTVSSGALNASTGQYNVPGPDAPNDRWLIAWQPYLAGKSEPRRIGGPDFSGSGGNTITAANGVVAATFVLGGPQPGAGFTGSAPVPTPVPESLTHLMQDGTTSCSRAAPCLFFETSSDQGQHWTRHHVVVPGGFSAQWSNVSADPGRRGRYAISVLNPDRTQLLVMVTDDSGTTWSRPTAVPETATGADFKQWMDYGPTGVLGIVWRKERRDLTPPGPSPDTRLTPQAFQEATGPAFDVYSAVSCDGGATWTAAARINAETSPFGPTAEDDFSYIALDAHYAHLVWGDRRLMGQVHNAPGTKGGIQTFYGRVPFLTLTNGAACGRQ